MQRVLTSVRVFGFHGISKDSGNQGRISQIAVFQRRGDTLLTFTFSTSLSLKNSQKTMLLEVIKSFTPLPPENDIQKDQPR